MTDISAIGPKELREIPLLCVTISVAEVLGCVIIYSCTCLCCWCSSRCTQFRLWQDFLSSFVLDRPLLSFALPSCSVPRSLLPDEHGTRIHFSLGANVGHAVY